MRKLIFLMFLILSPAGCDIWRTPEVEAKLNRICSNRCRILNSSYNIGAETNGFGCAFNYLCICNPVVKAGSSGSWAIEIKVSKEEVENLKPEGYVCGEQGCYRTDGGLNE